jgi:hypothetical protein
VVERHLALQNPNLLRLYENVQVSIDGSEPCFPTFDIFCQGFTSNRQRVSVDKVSVLEQIPRYRLSIE